MSRGFTLIELVIVIIVLGIIAAVAIPYYADLQEDARKAAELAVVGSVREAIANAHVAYVMGQAATKYPGVAFNAESGYPVHLDASSSGVSSNSNPFFTYVLSQPMTDGTWKRGPLDMYYTGQDLDDVGDKYYYYSYATGTFSEEEVVPVELL